MIPRRQFIDKRTPEEIAYQEEQYNKRKKNLLRFDRQQATLRAKAQIIGELNDKLWMCNTTDEIAAAGNSRYKLLSQEKLDILSGKRKVWS